jgi:hypothetical protein
VKKGLLTAAEKSNKFFVLNRSLCFIEIVCGSKLVFLVFCIICFISRGSKKRLEGKKFLKEWRKKHSNEKKLYVSSHVAVKKND